MSDAENQQENTTGQKMETAQVPIDPKSETITNEGDTGEMADWELELAKAYQQAEEAKRETDVSSSLQDQVAELTQINQSLQNQWQTIKNQFDDVSNQYRRLGADFDNYRKRMEKQKEELEILVKCNTIKSLLPVIDNFDRARSHIKPQTDGEMAIHKSYQSVYKQIVDCLKQIGVSPMRPEGQQFDPNFHEALMSEPSPEEEGVILQELERGYTLGDRVLRHAKVKVSSGPPADANYEGSQVLQVEMAPTESVVNDN